MDYYNYSQYFNTLIQQTSDVEKNQEEIITNQGMIYNSLNTISLLLILIIILRLIKACFGGTK